MRPLNEIVTTRVRTSYVPVKDTVPRAPANLAEPRVTLARPVNDAPLAAPAHACPPRSESLIAPGRPLSRAVPVKSMHSPVTNPWPEARNVLGPIGLPRPVAVALPDAALPFACPDA